MYELELVKDVYDLSLQSYNLRKFLKIVQSCTGFLGVAGPSTKIHYFASMKSSYIPYIIRQLQYMYV